MENAKRIGDFILKRTADWTQKFKNVGEVRGRGLMIGIEFVKDQKTKEKASGAAQPADSGGVPQGSAAARVGRYHAAVLPAAGDRRGAGGVRGEDAGRMHPRRRKRSNAREQSESEVERKRTRSRGCREERAMAATGFLFILSSANDWPRYGL